MMDMIQPPPSSPPIENSSNTNSDIDLSQPIPCFNSVTIQSSSSATSQNRIDRLFVILETGQSTHARQRAADQLADVAGLRPETLPSISHRLLTTLLCQSTSTNPSPGSSINGMGPSGWEIREAASTALGCLVPHWLHKKATSSGDFNQTSKEKPFDQEKQERAELEGYLSSFDLLSMVMHGEKLLSSAGTEYDEETLTTNFESRKKRLENARAEVQKATGGSLGPNIPGTTSLPIDWLGEEDLTVTSFAAKKKTPLPSSTVKKMKKNQEGTSFSSGPIVPKLPEPRDLGHVIFLLATVGLLNEIWTIRHGSVLGLDAVFEALLSLGTISIYGEDNVPAKSSTPITNQLTNISNQPSNMTIITALNSTDGDTWLGRVMVLAAFKILHLLATECFGDFVGERTVAPVREAAASLMHAVILFFSFQNNPVLIYQNTKNTSKQPMAQCLLESIFLLSEKINQIPWHARHASLLVIKVLCQKQYPFLTTSCINRIGHILADALAEDEDEDIRLVAAETLLHIFTADDVVDQAKINEISTAFRDEETLTMEIQDSSPEIITKSLRNEGFITPNILIRRTLPILRLRALLCTHLTNTLMEDLSPVTAVSLQLLAVLLEESSLGIHRNNGKKYIEYYNQTPTTLSNHSSVTIDNQLHITNAPTTVSKNRSRNHSFTTLKEMELLLSRLLVYSRHPARAVRAAVLGTLGSFFSGPSGCVEPNDGTDSSINLLCIPSTEACSLFKALFQSMLLEDDYILLSESFSLWIQLTKGNLIKKENFILPNQTLLDMRALLWQHPLTPYSRDAFPWASTSDLGFTSADICTLIIPTNSGPNDGKRNASQPMNPNSLPRILNKWFCARALGSMFKANGWHIAEIMDFFPPWLIQIQGGPMSTGTWQVMASAWVISSTFSRDSLLIGSDPEIGLCNTDSNANSGSLDIYGRLLQLWNLSLIPLSQDTIFFWEEEREIIGAIQRHLSSNKDLTEKNHLTNVPALLAAAKNHCQFLHELSDRPSDKSGDLDAKERTSSINTLQALCSTLKNIHEQRRLQLWGVLATLFVQLLPSCIPKCSEAIDNTQDHSTNIIKDPSTYMKPAHSCHVDRNTLLSTQNISTTIGGIPIFALNPVLRPLVSWLRCDEPDNGRLLTPIKQQAADALTRLLFLLVSPGPNVISELFSVSQPMSAASKAFSNMLIGIGVDEMASFIKEESKSFDSIDDEIPDTEHSLSESTLKEMKPLARAFLSVHSIIKSCIDVKKDSLDRWVEWVQDSLFPPGISILRKLQLAWLSMIASPESITFDEISLTLSVGPIHILNIPTDLSVFDDNARNIVISDIISTDGTGDLGLFNNTGLADGSNNLACIRWGARVLAMACGRVGKIPGVSFPMVRQHQSQLEGVIERKHSHALLQALVRPGSKISLLDEKFFFSSQFTTVSNIAYRLKQEAVLEAMIEIFCPSILTNSDDDEYTRLEQDGQKEPSKDLMLDRNLKEILPYMPLLAPSLMGLLSSPVSSIRKKAAQCFAAVMQAISLQQTTPALSHLLPFSNDRVLVQMRQDALDFCDQLFRPSSIPPYDAGIVYGSDIQDTAALESGVLTKILDSSITPDSGIFPPTTEQSSSLEEPAFSLRPYQRDGVSWLAFLARYGLHGILCDDMGLGKTIQMLTVLASGIDQLTKLPSLIIAPPSLLQHWKSECERLTGAYLNPMVYHGSERSALLSNIISGANDGHVSTSYVVGSSIDSFDISSTHKPLGNIGNNTLHSRGLLVITSYDVARLDAELLASRPWAWIVLDEGHAIRNPRSKATLAVKRLSARHRVILSGTPIQNSPVELWSLFDFLMPGYLGESLGHFMKNYGRAVQSASNSTSKLLRKKLLRKASEALERLHRVTNPFMLRRMKEDVLDDLPPKVITDVLVDLGPDLRALYESVLRNDMEHGVHIFATIRTLLRICSCPSLLLSGTDVENGGTSGFGAEDFDPTIDRDLGPTLIGSDKKLRSIAATSHTGRLVSPKVVAFYELLATCGISPGGPPYAHRAIVIFQSVSVLEWVEKFFISTFPGVAYLRLDGSITASRRGGVVESFNSDLGIACLFMTIGVGGEGLNLTGADVVIFYESDWNPTKDLQAMDRAHRLGQKKSVSVYRLLTRGTLEERLLSLQRFKLHMAASIITQQNSSLSKMDTTKLVQLLSLSSDQSNGY